VRNSILFDRARPGSVFYCSQRCAWEGKSTIRRASGDHPRPSGHRTLLIDGDLRRPRLHRRWHLGRRGLSSICATKILAQKPGKCGEIPELDVAPGGAAAAPRGRSHRAGLAQIVGRAYWNMTW